MTLSGVSTMGDEVSSSVDCAGGVEGGAGTSLEVPSGASIGPVTKSNAIVLRILSA